MRFYIAISSIFLITIFACQATRAKKSERESKSTDCTDINGNGICDNKDTDGDGVLDEEENRRGTDPYSSDTDGDGADDRCEIQNNSDPLDNTKISEICKQQSQPPLTSTDDPALVLACLTYQNQKEQQNWLNENLPETKCTEVPPDIEQGSGEIPSNEPIPPTEPSTVCETSYPDGTVHSKAVNYGDPDAGELKEVTITVSWGVSFRDILIVSNGIMRIVPWYQFFYDKYHSWYYDDLRWDMHLGDLPSTADGCDNSVKGKASVKINGKEYTWMQPAFLPFKIPEYINKYPFSVDGVRMGGAYDSGLNGIGLIGVGFNNFTEPTFLIRVENTNVSKYTKRYNKACKTREVSFVIEYYKEKSDADVYGYDLDSLEEQCKEILGNTVE